MSKKRKTRKEKIRSQERHRHIISQEPSSLYSFQPQAVPSMVSPTSSTPQESVVPVTYGHYAYVTHDMRQTAFITTLLLAASTVFYVLIQNHFIRLPMFGY